MEEEVPPIMRIPGEVSNNLTKNILARVQFFTHRKFVFRCGQLFSTNYQPHPLHKNIFSRYA